MTKQTPVVVIESPDTDMAVHLCAHATAISCRLMFKAGTGKKARFVDISAISSKLRPAFCEALPGLHAVTGCDSTSAFVGRGKRKGFQLLKE